MKTKLAILLLVLLVSVAGCATEDWNSTTSERPSGYQGGHHH